MINEVRGHVDRWRQLAPSQWGVTPETARLLTYWRSHTFSGVRPFFCQIEAVETAIWLTEVAPHYASGKKIIAYLLAANKDANPELLYTHWRDPGEEWKLLLFGQLKRLTKEWLDSYLVCKGETYPALLMYQELADMACERITKAISFAYEGERPIHALLDPYNPIGSTRHVRFNTSNTLRWETSSDRCHVNSVILHSDWEAEFCRVAEKHPKVRAYVKNYNLGLEVPYRYGSETRKYIPDFIVLIDDGHDEDDLLHLIIEIKGYRREDAKDKKLTMDTYWVPGVNHLGTYGRWAFAEFTDVYQIESDFAEKVEDEFSKMIQGAITATRVMV